MVVGAALGNTQNLPRELLDLHSRVVPGDGVAPLGAILRRLVQRGYAGPISVELFLPKYQQADPFELAAEIKRKSEATFQLVGR